MSHFPLFVSDNTFIYKAALAVLLMSTLSTLGVTTSLASFKMSFDVLLGRRAHLFFIMFMKFDLDLPLIDDFDVASRHILRRRLVSTLWTRPHIMNIDRSQSHHRKQM